MVATDIKNNTAKGFSYWDHRAVPCGYEIAFRIPLGLDPKKIRRQLEALSVATGTIIELEFDYPLVVIRIVEKDFPQMIPLDLSDLRDDSLLIGYTRNGEAIYHPFNRSMLMGGASGMGKTDLIRLIAFQLLLQGCVIKFIDMKTFSFFPFIGLPNVEIATSLEDAEETLEDAVNEMDRRADIIIKNRDRSLAKDFQKLAVIIDEAAEVAPSEYSDKKDKAIAQSCDKMCSHVARLGRELKTILLYTTQRPSHEVINGQVKANVDTKIAFHTATAANSFIILDRPGAEKIGSDHPGRCIYSGPSGEFMLQVPYVGDDAAWEILLAERLQHEPTPRKDIESSDRATLGIDAAISGIERFAEPAKESIETVAGVGKRKDGRVAMVRKAEVVETLEEDWEEVT